MTTHQEAEAHVAWRGEPLTRRWERGKSPGARSSPTSLSSQLLFPPPTRRPHGNASNRPSQVPLYGFTTAPAHAPLRWRQEHSVARCCPRMRKAPGDAQTRKRAPPPRGALQLPSAGAVPVPGRADGISGGGREGAARAELTIYGHRQRRAARGAAASWFGPRR